ncbi:MAG TPA: pectate lyase, partial [Pelobium sp.]|nr:pectate lyase [Pelobium sp.]
DYRNNVIYNWGNNSSYGGEAMNINLVNNYYKPGPASGKRDRIFSIDKNKNVGTEVYDRWGKFFIDGNFVEGSTSSTNNNWTYGVYNQFHGSYGTVSEADKAAMKRSTPHPINNNVTTQTAEKAYESVLNYAGASLKRDFIDTRIILHTRNGTFYKAGSNGSTNGIIDTQADVDGWPQLTQGTVLTDIDKDGMPDTWETEKKLDPKVANAANYDLSTGYTNIEVYINSLVKDITDNQLK